MSYQNDNICYDDSLIGKRNFRITNNISDDPIRNSDRNINRYHINSSNLVPNKNKSINNNSNVYPDSFIADDDKGDDLDDVWNTFDSFSFKDWGIDHPNYGIHPTSKQRAKFSKAELIYLANWILKNQQEAYHEYNPVYRCLTSIRKDTAALRIFHKRHILKSDRLRPGYIRCFNKLKQLNRI